MAVQLISFPFRLRSNGRVAKVEQDSDAHIAEAIASIVMTRPGERELVPEFGINDPAFETVYPSQLTSQVDEFEVPCTIVDVASRYRDDGILDITVHFD